LFDWKTFYSNKSHLKFPSILCFPEFYAHTVATLLNWGLYVKHNNNNNNNNNKNNEKSIKAICKLMFTFFDSLQTAINLIFSLEHSIQVKSPYEMQSMLNDYLDANNITDDSIFCLEPFLKDYNSVINYRNALLSTTLKYYRVDNIKDFIQYLYDGNCCYENTNCEDIREYPPDSKHYVRMNSNCTNLPPHIVGPNKWGPYYWNIFHSLSAKASQLPSLDDKVLYFLNAYVNILPFIIPCPNCRIHYQLKIKSSRIPFCKTIDEIIRVFDRIHKLVTFNVQAVENERFINYY